MRGGDLVMSSFPIQVPPLARMAVDRTSCLVGEDIAVAYEYYNPTTENVTFYPPSQITIHFTQAGEENDVGVFCQLNRAFASTTLKPGESFTIYRDLFTTEKPGNMTITINRLTETILVSPSKP